MKKVLMAGIAFIMVMLAESCGEPAEITVSTRPMQPLYTRPVSPGGGYVWIDGDWVYRGGRYHWREGRWRRGGTRIWISGSWESRNNGWYWRRGHWQ